MAQANRISVHCVARLATCKENKAKRAAMGPVAQLRLLFLNVHLHLLLLLNAVAKSQIQDASAARPAISLDAPLA